MRKLLILCLIAVAIPAAALTRPLPQGPNGTLSFREARGVVNLYARGSMTGRLNGRVTITDPKPYDAKRPIVYGATRTIYRNERTTVFQGKNLRFRAIGAQFRIKAEGKAIFVSALARGIVTLDGVGDVNANIYFDGTFALNEQAPRSRPNVSTTYHLVASPPG